jgi:2-methylcitrate dehydratase PrpD
LANEKFLKAGVEEENCMENNAAGTSPHRDLSLARPPANTAPDRVMNGLEESPLPNADAIIGATRALARFAAGSREIEIDEATRHEAARSLISWFGCALGGAGHRTIDIAVATIGDLGSTGNARLVGRSERFAPIDATLINGMSASVLDFDATQGKLTNIHPSGPVLPALLGFCEGKEITGLSFLRAYIVGAEVACRVANDVFGKGNPGWHVTGACGGLGAAAAIGCLLELDEDRMTHALGIAATQASGLREMYGTMCKSFTPGRVAQNGFLGALLASRGYSSAEQAIEGKTGLAHVMTGNVPTASMLSNLGRAPFEIEANIHKPFPCAIVTHAAIDGCLNLLSSHEFSIASIDRVALTVSPVALELAGKPNPSTGLESKFSIQHTVALALVKRRVSYRDFSDQVARDQELKAFRSKIDVSADRAFSKLQAYIEIHLEDGTVLSHRVDDPLGSAGNPMSDEGLEDKLVDLAEGIIPAQNIRNLIDACWKVEHLQDISTFLDLTAQKPI